MLVLLTACVAGKADTGSRETAAPVETGDTHLDTGKTGHTGHTGAIDADGDGFDADQDCDDGNPDIHPDAIEECDGVDNNCDGQVDESGSTAIPVYADTDGDGFGDASSATTACHEAPDGFTQDGTDCDDTDADVHPGAEEICDGKDSDCDGHIGEVRVPTDYGTIQAGVDSGEPTICIEAGTYYENVEIAYTTGFTLRGVGSDHVVLDGRGDWRTLGCVDNHDLTLGGFTVQNGSLPRDYGAGLLVEGGSAHVEDVVITANHATGGNWGHGMTVLNTDTFVGQDIEVYANTVDTGSETAFAPLLLVFNTSVELDGVLVRDHDLDGNVHSVGLMSYDNQSVTLSNVDVLDNTFDGGAVRGAFVSWEDGTVDLSHIAVQGNTLTGSSSVAPMTVHADRGSADHVDVRANRSTVTGGAAWSGGVLVDMQVSPLSLDNVIVAGNALHGSGATSFSSGLVSDGVGVRLTNADVFGNDNARSTGTSALAGRGDQDVFTNVSVVGNTAVTGTTVQLSSCGWCNAYDNDGAVAFSIQADPAYADTSGAAPQTWDFSLQSTSPLIDQGDPSVLDADGTTSDIGAHGGPNADW